MAPTSVWEPLLAERALLSRVVALAKNSKALLHTSRRLRSAVLHADVGERVLRSEAVVANVDAQQCLSYIALASRTGAALRVELSDWGLYVAGWPVEELPAEVGAAFRAAQPRTVVDVEMSADAANMSGDLAPWLGRLWVLDVRRTTPELRAFLCSVLTPHAGGAQLRSAGMPATELELLAACSTARIVRLYGRIHAFQADGNTCIQKENTFGSWHNVAAGSTMDLSHQLSCFERLTELHLDGFCRATNVDGVKQLCALKQLASLKLLCDGDPQLAPELVRALACEITASKTLQQLHVFPTALDGRTAAALVRALPITTRDFKIFDVAREHFLSEGDIAQELRRLRRLRIFAVSPPCSAWQLHTAREERFIGSVRHEFPHIQELKLVLAPE